MVMSGSHKVPELHAPRNARRVSCHSLPPRAGCDATANQTRAGHRAPHAREAHCARRCSQDRCCASHGAAHSDGSRGGQQEPESLLQTPQGLLPLGPLNTLWILCTLLSCPLLWKLAATLEPTLGPVKRQPCQILRHSALHLLGELCPNLTLFCAKP